MADIFETRSLRATDLDAVFSISTQVSFGQAWSRAKLETEIAQARSLAMFTTKSNGASLVAFVFYREVGAALEISWLATHPGWQRRGRMLALLIGLADAAGHAQELWLEVHESNQDARNLYEKMGFVMTTMRPRYYPDGGAALLLTLRLT
jgi:[ribosomal protein S18]-alanine N-acetyltransferase